MRTRITCTIGDEQLADETPHYDHAPLRVVLPVQKDGTLVPKADGDDFGRGESGDEVWFATSL